MYQHRIIESSLKKYLTIFPAVGITGPRQSGKSTLLQHCLGSNYRYVTFDDHEVIDALYTDPKRFMQVYNNKVIFDEVQKAPEIFNHLKLAIDNDRQNYGKFVVTGSSQFSMVSKITESLAGRIGLLKLLPFQYVEIPPSLRNEALYKGSYPEIVNRHYESHTAWYMSYLTTYLEKDVRDISRIGDLRDFNQLLRLLAANVSETLNMSRLANDLGVAVSTVKRWISVLEASYIIFLLPPFSKNSRKRLTKMPKIYFYDTGLVAYLTRIRDEELFEHGPMKGKLFENFIVSEVLKRELHHQRNSELAYYRTSHGVEIDLIIDRFTHKELIEVKCSSTFKTRMVKPIQDLMNKGDKGFLVYRGNGVDHVKPIEVVNFDGFLSM